MGLVKEYRNLRSDKTILKKSDIIKLFSENWN